MSDKYDVVIIRPGQRGEIAHTTDNHSDGYKQATEAWEGLKAEPGARGAEVRMVRTDRWGCAFISGRWIVPAV